MSLLRYIRRLRAGLNNITIQYVAPYDRTKYGKIGEHSIVKSNSLLVPENMFLDDYVVIQEHTNFISNKGKLVVGKYSVISSGCTIIPGTHTLTVGVPFYLSTINHINDLEGDVIIEEDCWIGAGCILLPGIHVGRGAVVGAGSVVKKDVPPYGVVVGVPAKIVASKFTIEEIIKHEEILYPENDRIKRDKLASLFEEHYAEKKSIGSDNLSLDDLKRVEKIRQDVGIVNYKTK